MCVDRHKRVTAILYCVVYMDVEINSITAMLYYLLYSTCSTMPKSLINKQQQHMHANTVMKLN